MKELSKLVNKEQTSMKSDLFQKHFSFDRPIALLKSLSRAKDKIKNKELGDLTKSGLSDLKNEIKEMSENEIGVEEPDEIVDIEFNRQN